MNKRNTFLISTIAASLLTSQSFANSDTAETNTTLQQTIPASKDIAYVPYVFSTDSTGFAGGVGVIKQGFLQPQTTAIATLFYGAEQDIITNGKPDTANFSGGFAAIFDYLIPGTDRLLFSALGMKAYFPKARYYLYDHAHNSEEDSYVETSGDSDFIYATLEYVLPMGDGINNPEGHYVLQNGFALNREGYGGGVPFVTGRTSLGITGFLNIIHLKTINLLFQGKITLLKDWKSGIPMVSVSLLIMTIQTTTSILHADISSDCNIQEISDGETLKRHGISLNSNTITISICQLSLLHSRMYLL